MGCFAIFVAFGKARVVWLGEFGEIREKLVVIRGAPWLGLSVERFVRTNFDGIPILTG